MLKIRLKRIGKRHAPHYKIVVMPARTKRDGKTVEYLGHYNPVTKETKLDVDRAKYWLSVGAQPTKTVHSILAKHKLLEQLPRPERPPLKPKKEQSTEDKKDAEKTGEKKEKSEPTKEQPKEKKADDTKEQKKETKKDVKKAKKTEKKE